MLSFFRKYQKFFFIFVTIMTISTFVFFGTYQVSTPNRDAEDSVLFKRLQGREIHRFYFEKLCRLIGSENVDPSQISLLNDGILKRDILDVGAADLIYAQFGKEIEGELTSKWQKEKQFRSYSHPEGRFLSARSIWSMLGSDLGDKLKQFQTNTNSFQKRVDLYLAEREFPPALLTYILRIKEREYQFASDPRLQNTSLALFGYKTSEDWFGKRFIEASASLILNGASYAKAKGYVVTRDEVMADLMVRYEEFASQKGASNRIPQADELIKNEMMAFGLSQDEFFEMLSDIHLYRRLLDDVGSTIIPDALCFRSFYSYAQEAVDINLYEIQGTYDLRTFEDFKRFECYLAHVATKRAASTLLPEKFDAIADIEKRSPEFIRSRMVFDVASTIPQEQQNRVALRDIWAWEQDPINLKKIQAEFPGLVYDAKSPNEVFNQLSKEEKEHLDQFALREIVKAHPEWNALTLQDKKAEEKTFLVARDGRGLLIDGITDKKELLARLEKEPILNNYTQDGKHYFRIEIKSKSDAKEVLSYQDALKEGILDEFLEKEKDSVNYLETAKRVVNLASDIGFQFPEGLREKPIEEVAPRLRFVAFLENYRKQPAFRDPSHVLTAEEIAHNIAMPWSPLKRAASLVRSKPNFVSFEEAKNLSKDEISFVKLNENGIPYFYQIVDKRQNTEIPKDRLFQAQALLSEEAKRSVIQSLMLDMQKEKAYPTRDLVQIEKSAA